MKHVVYRRFATIVPKYPYTRVGRMLGYAGIEEDPDVWVGIRVLLALLSFVIGALVPFSVLRMMGFYTFEFTAMTGADMIFLAGLSIAFGVAFLGISTLLFYLHVYYLIHDRTKRVEEVLPDFLFMIAANLRAGLTPFAAFQAAARPEFGPLEREIRVVATKTLGSISFTDALNQLTERIDSGILRRTVVFFEEGLKSGGRMAQLLETSAMEMRESEGLKKELVVSTRTYTLFLISILIFGLPLLLAISSQFLVTFSQIGSQLGQGEVSGITTITVPTMSIDAGFVGNIALAIIVGSSLLVSIFMGVIAEGKLLYGLKNFPLLALSSWVMFLLFRFVALSFIGQLV
jgi:flagellar protein FlaJ